MATPVAATYKKQPGTLTMAQNVMVWTPTASGVPGLKIPLATIKSQMQTPVNAPKVMLRLIVVDGGGVQSNYEFRFTSPNALPERDTFRDAITHFMASSSTPSSGGGTTPPSGGSTPAPASKSRSTPTPSATPVASVRAITDLPLAQEIKLRADLLRQHRPLARLHQELVRNGHVGEQDFWESRKHLLQTAAMQGSQKRGQSSAWLADVRPQTDKNGEMRFTLTPQKIQSIFLQYPSIEAAYKLNISEQEFWRRYFQSQFFHRMRSKSAARDAAAAKDDIFDQCLEEEQEALAPNKRLRLHGVPQALNLEATESDKLDENGNAPDRTMRHVDESVPIIRRFNRHSELVLRALQLRGPASTAGSLEKEITLDDLAVHQVVDALPLHLSNQDQYHQGRLGAFATANGGGHEMNGHNVGDLVGEITAWRVALGDGLNLERLHLSAKELSSYTTRSVRGKRTADQLEETLPAEFLAKVKEIQSTGNELLRHYWSSVRGVMTSEKRAKMRRMTDALHTLVGERGVALRRQIESASDVQQLAKLDLLNMLDTAMHTYERAFAPR
ncbi:RNA polymerase II transcription factor B subunit 1 [Sorochytrium milnesiophthora]